VPDIQRRRPQMEPVGRGEHAYREGVCVSRAPSDPVPSLSDMCLFLGYPA
jgi:hypothetical protein